MLQIFFKLLRSRTIRNVGLVSMGQMSAQIITFAAMPLLTRIYDPHEIGIQGLFLSVVGVFLTFSTLNIPLALVLPREEREARSLLKLSICISLASFPLIEAALFLGGGRALTWLGAEELIPYRHAIALYVTLMSITTAFAQYFVRAQIFRDQANILVVNAVALNATRLGLGSILATASNLILANLLAVTLNLLQYLWRWRVHFKPIPNRMSVGDFWDLLLRYRDFPLFRTPQITINAVSQFLPLWLLASYVGPSAAGQYAIALSLLSAPTALFGKAIGDVFYPQLTERHHMGVSIRPLILRATLTSAVILIVPFTTIALFGAQIFEFVYGAGWSQAGEYAQWLSYWCMLQAVNRPSVVAAAVLNIQGGLLIYELFSTSAKLMALWLGFAFFQDDMKAVALFSIAGILAYIWLIAWVVLRSGTPNRLRGE